MARFEDFTVTKLRLAEISNPAVTGYTKGINPMYSMWDGCPDTAYSDPSLAWTYMEDFDDFQLDGSDEPTVGWNWAEDAGATTALTTGTTGGIITVKTNITQDNGCAMQIGTSTAGTIIEYTGSSGKESWTEFRVSAAQSAVSDQSIFIGLAEEGSAAADFIADAGNDFADKDLIGFTMWEADAGDWDFCYQTELGTFGTIADVAENDAGDWHRLGWHFDGVTTLTVWADGVAHSTTLDTTADYFPDAEELSPIIAVKNHAGTARSVQLDYIKIVCER